MLRMAGRGMLRTIGLLPRRPFGVTLLSVGFLVGGLVTVVLGLLEAARGRGGDPSTDALLTIFKGAIYVVTSFGLWDLRQWGWWLGIAVAAGSLVLSMGSLFWALLWAGVLVYLLLVHASFQTFWQRARAVRSRS